MMFHWFQLLVKVILDMGISTKSEQSIKPITNYGVRFYNRHHITSSQVNIVAFLHVHINVCYVLFHWTDCTIKDLFYKNKHENNTLFHFELPERYIEDSLAVNYFYYLVPLKITKIVHKYYFSYTWVYWKKDRYCFVALIRRLEI